MIKWTVGVLVFVALGACKKGGGSLEEQAESLRARACACTDMGCLDKVYKDVPALVKRVGDEMKPDQRNERVEKAMTEMSACQQRLLGPVFDAAPPGVDGPPPDAMPDSKYGYCEVTVTGAREGKMRVPLGDDKVGSHHWLSKEDLALRKQKLGEVEKREGLSGDFIIPLELACSDADLVSVKIKSFHEGPRKKLLGDIKKLPGDHAIAKDDKAPFEGLVSLLNRNALSTSLDVVTGTLHVTRFEPGELEATFDLDAAKSGDAASKVHVSGKIVYHCADYARCGVGRGVR